MDAPKRRKAVPPQDAPADGRNGHTLSVSDPHQWVQQERLGSTADLPLPELLIDEVIGQEEAVEVAREAARQLRHLLLLGDPGTGKSMIAKAMAQILPPAHLDDVLCYGNPKDQNVPLIQVFKGGEGRDAAMEANQKAMRKSLLFRILEIVFSIGLVGGGTAAFFLMGGGPSARKH